VYHSIEFHESHCVQAGLRRMVISKTSSQTQIAAFALGNGLYSVQYTTWCRNPTLFGPFWKLLMEDGKPGSKAWAELTFHQVGRS